MVLLTEFPKAANNREEQKRTSLFIPGPIGGVTNAIADGRMHIRDICVKDLLTQPPRISKSIILREILWHLGKAISKQILMKNFPTSALNRFLRGERRAVEKFPAGDSYYPTENARRPYGW